ncbi:MAG: Gfo/Idh/MocA family oxidoreductase [Armatimonadetes bacterium]|nr:Gfo/Idh/MocA family oxidoreductase [Armatimonadota bacterium]MDW8122407.1 Gfo/Idh/MocA family oxidoreductase [Armatimonadota bacterium]
MTDKKEPIIRMGVVGGGFGAAFYWHRHPHCQVAAVADLIPERRRHLQNVYQCPTAYESLEEMLKDPQVDAVALFTPAPNHARDAIACLKAGKSVFCAVPAALTIEEAEALLETVKRTGLTYMMAETSYYHQIVISARKFYQEGKFGEIFYSEAEYHHPGLDVLWWGRDEKPTWRYAYPPMLYITHCTAYLVGVTKERLTSVSALGWGPKDITYQPNPYNNPFLNETALFHTDQGHTFRVCVFWHGAMRGCERGQWYGEKMSLFGSHPNGLGPIIVRQEDSSYVVEPYEQPQWWKSEMLPEGLRYESGHDGSHPFLVHEFIDALINERSPAIDIYEALAMTVPGIVAHQSALRDGEQLKIPSYDPER